MAPVNEKKDPVLAYALWCLSLVGICGVQRMYLGQFGWGVAMLFTFGFCGVAQLLDLLLIPGAVQTANQSLPSASPLMPAEALPPLPSSSPASTQSAESKSVAPDDEELAMLLEQAEQSFQRTENTLEDS